MHSQFSHPPSGTAVSEECPSGALPSGAVLSAPGAEAPPAGALPSAPDDAGKDFPGLLSGTPPQRLQDLPAAAARLCLDVRRFMERELGLDLAGKRLLAGFSGGADSTALLLVLRYLAPGMGFSLAAAHLDHALRPESAYEAAACRDFCRRLGLEWTQERIDVAGAARAANSGLEEAGRAARYAFFRRVMRQTGGDLLVLGHQNNDLAEDILMRLMRGAGWPGLSGMAGFDPRRRLARPLLLTPRARLEDFVRSLGIHCAEDASNRDQAFLRNRVRHTVLPLFLAENPAFLEHAADLWRMGRLDAGLFDSLLALARAGASGLCSGKAPEPDAFEAPASSAAPETTSPPEAPSPLPRETLASLHKALRLRLYKEKLDALGPGQICLKGLLDLDAAWENNPEPTEHRFAGGKLALVRRRAIAWDMKKRNR